MANIRIQKDVTLINTAKEEFGLIERLAPLKRTMICDDFDKALGILSQHMPLNIVRVPSGTGVLDLEDTSKVDGAISYYSQSRW